ncbi:S-adenosyl-L-methionine-dependent methyltransferase [Mycena olivaceomarginata]|nr:S-adenosyl-L-methionine-dependent methyltransferase [Mycena olivaceomarginata]
MEEITGVPAKAMLVQSGLLPTPPKDAVVLDNASGGGVVTSHLFGAIGKATDVRVVCGNFEEYMALPFPDNYFNHNLMNFGIQVIESFRVLKSGGKLGMTIWTSPGWLDSFKIAIKGFTMPPVFTGPFSTKESIAGLITAAGFTDIDVQPIKFEHTDDMGEVAKATLQGEVGKNYEAYMRKQHGDGDFVLTWEAFVITAEKP